MLDTKSTSGGHDAFWLKQAEGRLPVLCHFSIGANRRLADRSRLAGKNGHLAQPCRISALNALWLLHWDYPAPLTLEWKGRTMQGLWTRDFLTRRIDRCYLVASWARAAERRARHLALARYYRTMLMRMAPAASPA